jgi:glycerol-3-phosphate dehydrogenase
MPVVPALGPELRARAWAELAEQPFESSSSEAG